MMYRLSFVLWRVRSVMQLVVTYFLWWAIFSQHTELFGYTQSMMLTYILLGAIVRPLVMGTRTQEVGGMINDGSLSNYLIRPMNIFRFSLVATSATKRSIFCLPLWRLPFFYFPAPADIFASERFDSFLHCGITADRHDDLFLL